MFSRDRLEQLSLGLEQSLERGIFGGQHRGGFVSTGSSAGDFAIQRLTTHQDSLARVATARKER
jgi:hypothetical protein